VPPPSAFKNGSDILMSKTIGIYYSARPWPTNSDLLTFKHKHTDINLRIHQWTTMIKYITDAQVFTDLILTRLCLDLIYIRAGY
jgi:protein tyrosine/serine phosphatase